MLKCSYILYVHNNEETIPKVMDSITKINGNFRREFIIIDDGSTDQSLQAIKNHIKALPRATIVTQEHSGSAISINKALKLIKSDYVHFVSAKRPMLENETAILINACVENTVDVAFYSTIPRKNSDKINNVELIDKPFVEILNGIRFPEIKNIGETCGLVSSDLLIKVGGADEQVYTSSSSIALRCAAYSRFASVSREQDNQNYERETEQDDNVSFKTYNNIFAIYNFAKINPQFCESHAKELIYFLYTNSITFAQKINYLKMYLTAKYLNKYDLDSLVKRYRLMLDEMFRIK